MSYTTIGYKYSFVHEKSKEGYLYLVDNVENGIILSPEGPSLTEMLQNLTKFRELD